MSESDLARAGAQPGEIHDGCTTFCAEFEFEPTKKERVVSVDTVLASIAEGRFCWIDIDVNDPEPARRTITKLGLLREDELDAALSQDPATQLARYDEYLHLVVTAARLSGLHFDLERVDVIIRENYLLTLHRGPRLFLDAVRRTYRSGFLKFARTPSFLVFELWDHLIENYLDVQKQFEERV